MVSSSAFESALEAVQLEKRTSQDEWVHTLEQASSLANDPWTPGVFAQMTYPADLKGRYWVVAQNPGVDASGNYMIATNLKFAIIDLNIPKGHWYGAFARAAKRANPFLATGRCCGSPMMCLGVDGAPVGPCGQSMCGGTEYQSSALLDPTFLQRPPVVTQIWKDGAPRPPTKCLPQLSPGCASASYACGAGFEIDTNLSSEVPVQTPTCTGSNIERNTSGRVPPAECTYATYGGAGFRGSNRHTGRPFTAADCEGRCLGCESTNGPVDSKGLPRACYMQRPVAGGGLCEAGDAARQVQQASEQILFAQRGGTGSQRCDPPSSGSSGVRKCTTCENGTCRETIGIDPIAPNQTLTCPALNNCGLGGAVADTSGGSPTSDKVSGGAVPAGQPGSNRPARASTGTAQTVDTVNATTPDIPASSVQNAPVDDGQVTDNNANDANAETPEQLTSEDPKLGADPVSMMAGSLEISHTDLSFAGPVRPLEFTRRYSSQGSDRSELGSNWSHNWDVRIIPLRHENLPDGVDPFCAGTPVETTCVLVRSGNEAKLYMRDRRDGLFKPQAGSFSTVLQTDTGWYLRAPDFHIQRFDLDGYLVSDVDRFGNGVKLDYELNAWGRVDAALCPNAVLALNAPNGTWVDAMGPVFAASSLPCTLLSGLVGRTKPMLKSDPSVTLDTSSWPTSPPEFVTAKNLLVASQSGGVGNGSVWGQRKKRVTRVSEINDQGGNGRSLEFTYWADTETGLVPGSTTLRKAGLLKKVTGPAGAQVEFTYVAPSVPSRLNEALLAQAVRSDTNAAQPANVVAGPTRTYAFTYASPATTGTTMSSTQVADLRKRFEDYFLQSYQCSYVRYDPCGNPLIPAFTSLPGEEVDRRVDAFLSDEADNIITITAPNETVETRYEVNPLSLNFDKVTAQRWGSSAVTGSPNTSPNWTTTLPQATIEYAEESPDGTDGFLDSVIASRYGYEPVVAGTQQAAEAKKLMLAPNTSLTTNLNIPPSHFFTGSTPAGGVSPCRPDKEPLYRTWLPGYRKSYGYYALAAGTTAGPAAMTSGVVTPGVDLDMPLKRSFLSCGQLAEAQTWDANHNDLQTNFTAHSNGVYTTSSFGGRRPEMNLNANRICAWTKYVDRDGEQHVYGFNYHGRPLVDAVKVDGAWRFAETLYNADGNVISQRRVMPHSTPWSYAQGDTRYGYVEGLIVGSNFQEPSPWYWSQRGNLTAVLERPRLGPVTEEIEGTTNTETTIARYTEFFYEPLFSQVSMVMNGDVLGGAAPTRRLHRTTQLYYDYQECTASSSTCLQPLLEDAQKWGAQYPVDANDNVLSTNNPLSVATGLGDLNGDNVIGGPARGTLVRVVTSAGSMSETSMYRFGPHGKPFFLQSASGNVTAIDYLPFGGLSGVGHVNHRGYPSRVQVLRERSIPSTYGPTTPCPNLPGPYQWLLASSCGNTGLSGQLQSLAGLSGAIADEIERQANNVNAKFSANTAFEYTDLGVPSKVLNAEGSELRIIRDVDGRVREESLYETPTQLHSRTVITRNVQGLPTRTQRLNRSGGDLGSTWQTWDEEGKLLFECAEAAPNGCAGAAYGALPPNGSSRTVFYTKEGHLQTEMDSEGAYTTYGRDGRGWVKSINRTASGELDRLTTLQWDNDGNLLTRLEGPVGAHLRSEYRTYDGYNRLTTVTDSQGRYTQVKNSARDVVSSTLTGDYGQPPDWTVRYIRDGFARVAERWTNGQRTLQLWRMPGGRVWKRQALGSEPTFFAYDEFGEAVFRTQGDLRYVRVQPPELRFAASAVVRAGHRLQTTNLEQVLSALGDPMSETEVGSDGTSTPPSRTSTFARDDNGRLTELTDAVGATSEFVRDLLGRVTTQNVTVNPGVVKTTSYTFNNRGQLLTMSDPRGTGTSFGQTVQTYTGFGEPKTRTVPGGTAGSPSDVVSAWQYDRAGRLTSETMGSAELRFEYADDRVWRIKNAGEQVLREFGYDALGRLTVATNHNRGLLGMVGTTELPVVSTFGYDSLGRRVYESSRVGTRATRVTSSTWTLPGTWLRTVSRPDGTTQQEQYDGQGRLEDMARPWNGRTSKWHYQGDLLAEEDHGAATSVTRRLEYDGFSQLTGSRYDGNVNLYLSQLYRDKVGRLAAFNRFFKEAGQPDDKAWRGYKYQQGGAIEEVMELADAASNQGWDPTDTTWAQVRAFGVAKAAAEWAYTRDVEGSVLSVDRVDVSQAPRFKSPVRHRGYQTESVELDGRYFDVAHDTAGRVQKEFWRDYAYDDFHSLVRAGPVSGPDTQAFQYDGLGRLVAARRGTAGWPVEEEVAYDGTQMVAAWNEAGNGTWAAVWGSGVDNLISVKEPVDQTEVMAVKDGRGSVVGYWRAEATTPGYLATADYSPEGRATQKTWATSVTCTEEGNTQCGRLGGLPFGFHSAYKSPAHGLLYFRNRWYSVESGQWLTQDPLGEVDSVNLYAFNRFDGVNHVDPFGLSSEGAAPGRDPNDPKLQGGAEMDILRKGSGVDAALLADMDCQYLGKCATANLARLEATGKLSQSTEPAAPSPGAGPGSTGGRGGGRDNILMTTLLKELLAQIPKPAAPQRVVLVLVGKKIDSADPKSPLFKKHLGNYIGDFRKKVAEGVKDMNVANSEQRLGLMGVGFNVFKSSDKFVPVEYDGAKIVLPKGVDAKSVGVLVYFGHGTDNTAAITPTGVGGGQVSPSSFANQIRAAGLPGVSSVVLLGCETKDNGMAAGVQSEMPSSEVWGATGSIQVGYETDSKAMPIPSSSVSIDTEVHRAR